MGRFSDDIYKQFSEALNGMGVPITATTQTFNDVGANIHEDKFNKKMSDFDQKMSDWMDRFENGRSFKKFEKREKKTSAPPPIKKPTSSKTIREKELEEMVEAFKRKNKSLKDENDSFRKIIERQNRQINDVVPHLEKYADLIEKKKKKEKQGDVVKKIYERVVRWFNE